MMSPSPDLRARGTGLATLVVGLCWLVVLSVSSARSPPSTPG